jgi:AraC family transcriptional regulator, positive regulator of tynA and feaB
MMDLGSDLHAKASLNYDIWRDTLRKICGRYSPEGLEPKAFNGAVNAVRLYGFDAVDITSNAPRIERTARDVRLDRFEHYGAILQLGGRSTVIQYDQTIELSTGDVALVDSTRPATYISGDVPGRWIGLILPRRGLMSHLGLEPAEVLHRRAETAACRLLFHLCVMPRTNATFRWLRRTPTCRWRSTISSAHSLRRKRPPLPRIPTRCSCGSAASSRIALPIRTSVPARVAGEAGISLRYLQKLFTARGSTCSHFIHSLRLDRAAQLIRRRASMKTGQPLSMIAHACGFSDYTHFARAFRRRFGHPPGATGDRSVADNGARQS